MSILNEADISANMSRYVTLGEQSLSINFPFIQRKWIPQIKEEILKIVTAHNIDINICVDGLSQSSNLTLCIYSKSSLHDIKNHLCANSQNPQNMLHLTFVDKPEDEVRPVMQFLGLTPLEFKIKGLIDIFPKDKKFYGKLIVDIIAQIVAGIIVKMLTY